MAHINTLGCGWGFFSCNGHCVAVWVWYGAEGVSGGLMTDLGGNIVKVSGGGGGLRRRSGYASWHFRFHYLGCFFVEVYPQTWALVWLVGRRLLVPALCSLVLSCMWVLWVVAF